MAYKNEEDHKAYDAQYRERNRERLKQYMADYYNKNKDSVLAAKANYVANNKEKIMSSELLRTYGITLDEKKRIYAEQNGKCAICKKAAPVIGKSCLAIDHDHATGQIRGLLCNNCNRGIGCLQEDIEIMKSAILYIMGAADG